MGRFRDMIQLHPVARKLEVCFGFIHISTWFLGKSILIDEHDLPAHLQRRLPSPEEIAVVNVGSMFLQELFVMFPKTKPLLFFAFLDSPEVAIGNLSGNSPAVFKPLLIE
jgi:hypothetical protein